MTCNDKAIENIIKKMYTIGCPSDIGLNSIDSNGDYECSIDQATCRVCWLLALQQEPDEEGK